MTTLLSLYDKLTLPAAGYMLAAGLAATFLATLVAHVFDAETVLGWVIKLFFVCLFGGLGALSAVGPVWGWMEIVYPWARSLEDQYQDLLVVVMFILFWGVIMVSYRAVYELGRRLAGNPTEY